ncbi:uncharacterized protein [Littorina saxatilis]|uniref:uncharacterized protein n=1 Tax=Littorina saxatilis TaxID=31220 RepID=UPI0038B5A0E9
MQCFNMWMICAAVCVLNSVFLANAILRIDIENCDDPVEVQELTKLHVTCSAASAQTVTWSLDLSNGSSFSGQCTTTQCTNMTVTPKAILAFDSVDSTLIANVTRDVYGSSNVTCKPNNLLQQSQCRIDVIEKAQVTSCEGPTVIKNMTSWYVNALCTIQSAYSSRDNYTCRLLRDSEVIETRRYSPVNNATSTCNFTTELPAVNATNSYEIIVAPGAVKEQIGNVTVASPSAAPILECSPRTVDGFFEENRIIRCTCIAANLGQPAGNLIGYWNGGELASGNNNQISWNVTANRNDDGGVAKCILKWMTDLTTTLDIKVAYGPDLVTVSDPGVIDLDPASNLHSVTFTCNVTGVNPGVRLTWEGLCQGQTGSTCKVNVTANQNGSPVTCKANNTATGNMTSNTTAIAVNYPPPAAPVISGYSGPALSSGDQLSMFCRVDRGQPQVQTVTFTCGGQNQEHQGQRANFTKIVTKYDNGVVCVCSARWKIEEYYTMTKNVTLLVHYPPSPPNITYASQPYPFMEGGTPTLYCHFPAGHDPGNPPATLKLLSNQSNQRIEVVGQGEVNVTLTELSYLDNRRTAVCTAANNVAEVNATFQMLVYYKPNVTLTRQLQDACRIDPSDPRTCVVEDGERVQWKCQATAFPDPSSVAWQPSGTDVLDLTAQRSTKVDQVCEATTARLNNDPRLPLKSSVTLRVLVKYQASIKSFRANNTYTAQFTANENDPVSLACIANGRPTPNIRILRGEGEVESLPQGQVTAADEVALTYLIPEVRCEDAGEYRCVVTNEQGTGTARFPTATLTVNCKPNLAVPGKATESSSGLSGGAMAGIAVAMLLAVIIAVLVWLWWRHWTLPTCSFHAGPKRRRTKENAMKTDQNSQDERDLSTVDKGHIYSNMVGDQQNKQVGGFRGKRRAGRQSDREKAGGKDQDNADFRHYQNIKPIAPNWCEGSRHVYERPTPGVDDNENQYEPIGAAALKPPGYRRPSAPTVSTTDVHVYINDEDKEDSTDNPYTNFGRVAAATKKLELENLKLRTPK